MVSNTYLIATHINDSLFTGMTQQGKDRKKRVCRKVWHEETTTLLQLSVYMGVLAILKEYVMVFQVGVYFCYTLLKLCNQ